MCKKFKVVIAGSRDFDDYETLKEFCNKVLKDRMETNKIVIVSGNARGADRLGEKYAEEMGFEIDSHPALWGKYGKYAGFQRNIEMAEVADAAIMFWDGKSKGTKHMIEQCKQHHIPFRIKSFDNDNKETTLD